MSLALRLNRSKAADLFIAMVAMTPAVVIYFQSLSPDAAVYFTFIRNFFHLPFSYQPDAVSFGATSPLQVMIFAPFHAIFGAHWLSVSKFVNFLFVVFGMVFLNRALRGGTKTILLISLLVTLSTALLSSTAQLFETGLAFFTLAWIYYALTMKKFNLAAVLGGLLYLVRPELLVVGLAVHAYVIVQSEARKQTVLTALASYAPMVFYHLYMLIASGTILPAAMFTPIIVYIQEPTSWLQRLGFTLSALWGESGLIYIIGGVVIALLAVDWVVPKYTRELMLLAPLVVLYFIFPPGDQIVRYLVPITPILIVMTVRYVQQNLNMQYTINALVVCLVLAHGYGIATRAQQPTYRYDALLMHDLSSGLNNLAGASDPVLLDDIQGQYFIKAPCVSLKPAVGNQMVGVLLKRETVEDFIESEDIKYVVTSDATYAKPNSANSLYRGLQAFDQTSRVGDTVIVEGLAFKKSLSNPLVYSGGPQPANGTVVQRPDDGPRWRSVYAVLGNADAVNAARMARAEAMPKPDPFQMQAPPTQSDSTTTVAPTTDSARTAADPTVQPG